MTQMKKIKLINKLDIFYLRMNNNKNIDGLHNYFSFVMRKGLE